MLCVELLNCFIHIMKHTMSIVYILFNIIFLSFQREELPSINRKPMDEDLYFNYLRNSTYMKSKFEYTPSKCKNQSLVISNCHFMRRNPNFFNETIESRIVGGEMTTIEQYPYAVMYGYGCGGALINPRWIITAAHCGCRQSIFVGSSYRGMGTEYYVNRCEPHPGYFEEDWLHEMDFDIQLVELEIPVQIDNVTVATIKIGKRKEVKAGHYVTVTGWGAIKQGLTSTYQLRKVRVPIVEKSVCQAVDEEYYRGTLTERMFCAGYKEGGHDACQGDSGGAAISEKYRILGVVSFGIGCALPGVYGVYTDVTRFRHWIKETMS